ncbi:GNAT family N-acetyltransferase [Caulobacter sp. KR2-114]|uniref:GNAT family N-acetyltransferase n=1 Tax=Caulobacter sp. KR2-114 TaxID=3400912 RepID=UPI003C078511
MDIEAMRRSAEAPVDATAADLDGVAADLAAAFTDDAMFDWFLRADAKKSAARLKFFQFIVRNMGFGVGKIERPTTGGAAAIWMPFEWLGPQPLSAELRALPVLLGATGLARFGRLAAMREDMDKHHPMERRHAYLWFLGVAPEAQGRGVGSRLLKVGTDRCDAAGLPAYLETQTERNVALYRRHGFEVISEHRCRADAPLMWSMWREPQPVEA